MLTFVSQPLAVELSQLLNPETHAPAPAETVHAPDAQVCVATLGSAHTRPHAPQCATVVLVLVSQPLVTLPSQLPRPALQAMEHAPPLHVGVPPTFEQRLPQPPQCITLVSVLVSQPLVATPSQSP